MSRARPQISQRKDRCTFSSSFENPELQAVLFHQKYALKLTYMATPVWDQKLALKHRDKEWKEDGRGGERVVPNLSCTKAPLIARCTKEDKSLTTARNVLPCVRDKVSIDSNPHKTLMYNVCARAEDRRAGIAWRRACTLC